MKITDAPALITTPFAQNGTRNDIPATGDGLGTGRASLATGFPDETMKPITAGGAPPFGADFNGILYALSNAVRFYGAGGHYKFNADFAAKIGGYPMGATVQASDNMGHWLNVVESNSTDPESGLSTGWLPLADHNGTATVTLTGNTTLAPLQAAKANLRFTGAPTGNVTVTFPAWTKRYSIINDCSGDQSIICTTGNGESISIKNGAKYEVGCDGNNLTVATVNASQVFAEPNKNVSALDAPTVQQIINALGSAAAHAASDFDAFGSASAVQQSLDSLSNSLSVIAKSGKITDAIGDFPWSRISEKPTLGDASPLNTDKADWDGVGDTKETIATAHHIFGLRENAVLRDNIIKAGLSGGDITKPYFKSGGGTDVSLARADDLNALAKTVEDTKITRDNVTIAGFKNGNKTAPYFRHADNAIVDLARLEYVDALNTNMDNAKITRDNVTIAGFVNGNKFDPYFRHSSGEVVPLSRLAYVEEIKKTLTDGKVDRDNITTAGFLNGLSSSPYMSGPAGQTLLQERATSGATTTNGTITFPNVITMQYGSYNYPDITTVGTFTIPFNEPWSRIMCVLITVDSGQDVTAVTLNVTGSNFQVRIREWYNGTFGGTIRWFALGFK